MSNQKIFLLFGESGSGKSSFVNYILQSGTNDSKIIVPEGNGIKSCTTTTCRYDIKKSILGNVTLIDTQGTNDTNGVNDVLIWQNLMQIFFDEVKELKIDGLIYFQPLGAGTFHYEISKKSLKNIFDIDNKNVLVLLTHIDDFTEEGKKKKINIYATEQTELTILEWDNKNKNMKREINLIDGLKKLFPIKIICHDIISQNINEIAQQLYQTENQIIVATKKPIIKAKTSLITKKFIHTESLSGWGILKFIIPDEIKSAFNFYLMEIDNEEKHMNVKILEKKISSPKLEKAINCDIKLEEINNRNLKICSVLEFNSNQFGYGSSEFSIDIFYGWEELEFETTSTPQKMILKKEMVEYSSYLKDATKIYFLGLWKKIKKKLEDVFRSIEELSQNAQTPLRQKEVISIESIIKEHKGTINEKEKEEEKNKK